MKLTLKSISSMLALSTAVFAGPSFATYIETTNQMDSNAVAWLIVVNQNEIDMANEAKKRKLNTDVTNYANFMLSEHTHNLNKIKSISQKEKIEPIKDTDTISMENEGAKKLEEMKQLDDTKFQTEYVKTMINDHKNVVKALNKQYAPNVSNVALKQHFADTENHFSNHLEKAKDLDKKGQP